MAGWLERVGATVVVRGMYFVNGYRRHIFVLYGQVQTKPYVLTVSVLTVE